MINELISFDNLKSLVSNSPLLNNVQYLLSSSNTETLLPPEDDEGNVEYKWKLLDLSPDRVDHLATQMKFRLQEGGGCAVYYLGVCDDGTPLGLSVPDLSETLNNLIKVGKLLGHSVSVMKVIPATEGVIVKVKIEATPRAHLIIKEARVAFVGAAGCGKSTLIGTLVSGTLDDGRGRTRVGLFKHRHELLAGRTSTMSFALLGFNNLGEVISTNCEDADSPYSPPHGISNLAVVSDSLVQLIDLPGDSKYMKTKFRGLLYSGLQSMLIVIAPPIDSCRCEVKEFIEMAAILGLAVTVAITHAETLSIAKRTEVTSQVREILAGHDLVLDLGLSPTQNATSNDTKCSKRLECLKDQNSCISQNGASGKVARVLFTSAMTGEGLGELSAHLRTISVKQDSNCVTKRDLPFVYIIHEIYKDLGENELVVGGVIVQGSVKVGDEVRCGPYQKISETQRQWERKDFAACHASDPNSLRLKRSISLPDNLTRLIIDKSQAAICDKSKPNRLTSDTPHPFHQNDDQETNRNSSKEFSNIISSGECPPHLKGSPSASLDPNPSLSIGLSALSQPNALSGLNKPKPVIIIPSSTAGHQRCRSISGSLESPLSHNHTEKIVWSRAIIRSIRVHKIPVQTSVATQACSFGIQPILDTSNSELPDNIRKYDSCFPSPSPPPSLSFSPPPAPSSVFSSFHHTAPVSSCNSTTDVGLITTTTKTTTTTTSVMMTAKDIARVSDGSSMVVVNEGERAADDSLNFGTRGGEFIGNSNERNNYIKGSRKENQLPFISLRPGNALLKGVQTHHNIDYRDIFCSLTLLSSSEVLKESEQVIVYIHRIRQVAAVHRILNLTNQLRPSECSLVSLRFANRPEFSMKSMPVFVWGQGVKGCGFVVA